MIKKLAVGIILFTSLFSQAQEEKKAQGLLDEVYAKVSSYDNIFVDFKYSLYNADANISQDTRGDVTLQKDKYIFNYLGAQQLYDGKSVITIVPENEEVTIESNPDEENTITPSKMLTFYREGYRYAWDIPQTILGRKIQFVKLSPIDSNSEIKMILLGIDVETKHIYKLIQTGINGTKTTITVNSFKTNQTLPKNLFSFDEAKYKNEGYYILRN